MGVLDDDVVLGVHVADLREGSSSGTVAGRELSEGGEGLGSVDGQTGTVEASVTHAEGVEIATIRIANAGVAVANSTTLIATAGGLVWNRAKVRSNGSREAVSLPIIHLIRAGSHFTGVGVSRVGVGCPVSEICLGESY